MEERLYSTLGLEKLSFLTLLLVLNCLSIPKALQRLLYGFSAPLLIYHVDTYVLNEQAH